MNGAVVTKPSSKLKSVGDVVEYRMERGPKWAPGSEPAAENIPINVVYEDDHLIVVDKAAGMVVHPSCGHYTGTLVNALLFHCRQRLPTIAGGRSSADLRPGIIHRLDKGTSGLLVVAKDEYTMAHLGEQFRARTVKRTYTAVAAGVPREEVGKIESIIGRDPRNRLKMAVLPSLRLSTSADSELQSRVGKYACSRYAIVKTFASGRASVMLWRLHTGRTHQIRVHSQHIGHPIIGDRTYGGDGSCATSAFPCSRERAVAAIDSLGRPALHATTLGFKHPMTGEDMFFNSKIPDDMERLMRCLAGADA